MSMDQTAYEQQVYTVSNREIRLFVPKDEELSLSAAVDGQGVDPYWGKVWDSAIHTASCVLQSKFCDGTRTLEIGCGIGLVGIAALIAGHTVTFSDHDPSAVFLAEENAKLNGLSNFDGLILDWSKPNDQKFELIVASDVLYDSQSHSAILKLGSQMLAANGQMFIGDPGRQLAKDFLRLASDSGWSVRIFNEQLESVMTPFNNCFQLIVLNPTNA